MNSARNSERLSVQKSELNPVWKADYYRTPPVGNTSNDADLNTCQSSFGLQACSAGASWRDVRRGGEEVWHRLGCRILSTRVFQK